MLTEALSSHPGIHCFGALLNVAGWSDPNDDKAVALRYAIPPRWARQNARITNPMAFPQNVERVSPLDFRLGIKQHLGGHSSVIEALVAREWWPKILLTRAKMLTAYSSEETVGATGQGVVRMGTKPLTIKITFDSEAFENYADCRLRIYDRWRLPIREESRSFEIEYTKARTDSGIESMFDFVGVPRIPGQWGTQKRHTDRIIERFENRKDVERYLTKIGRSDWAEE